MGGRFWGGAIWGCGDDKVAIIIKNPKTLNLITCADSSVPGRGREGEMELGRRTGRQRSFFLGNVDSWNDMFVKNVDNCYKLEDSYSGNEHIKVVQVQVQVSDIFHMMVQIGKI